jgi:hypothetical protein
VSGAATMHTRLDAVARILRKYPHVTGVGFGIREVRGAMTSETAWRVYVDRKVSIAELPYDHVIPRHLAGWPTDVIPTLAARPASAPVDIGTEAIAPGMLISNLRGLLDAPDITPNTSGLGTLGFLALINGTQDRREVLVSNRHVLLAHGAIRGSAIYAPRFVDRGNPRVVSREGLRPIAAIEDEGYEGNHRFSYPGEAAAGYFVDGATALLAENQEWRANATIESGSEARSLRVRGIARLHALDLLGGRVQRVRKIGGASGVTDGRVVDVLAPVTSSGAADRLRNLMIRSAGGPFVEPGDSGALIVNDRDEAVGLLWGRSDTDPQIAYACHIHPLLDRLQVTMLAGAFV